MAKLGILRFWLVCQPGLQELSCDRTSVWRLWCWYRPPGSRRLSSPGAPTAYSPSRPGLAMCTSTQVRPPLGIHDRTLRTIAHSGQTFPSFSQPLCCLAGVRRRSAGGSGRTQLRCCRARRAVQRGQATVAVKPSAYTTVEIRDIDYQCRTRAGRATRPISCTHLGRQRYRAGREPAVKPALMLLRRHGSDVPACMTL